MVRKDLQQTISDFGFSLHRLSSALLSFSDPFKRAEREKCKKFTESVDEGLSSLYLPVPNLAGWNCNG